MSITIIADQLFQKNKTVKLMVFQNKKLDLRINIMQIKNSEKDQKGEKNEMLNIIYINQIFDDQIYSSFITYLIYHIFKYNLVLYLSIMVDNIKCLQKGHQNKICDLFCYSENCQNRRICSICATGTHKKHDTTSLQLNIQQDIFSSKQQDNQLFRINSKKKDNEDALKLEQSWFHLSNVIQILSELVNKIQQKMGKFQQLQRPIRTLIKIVGDSFKQDGNKIALDKIRNKDTKNQELNTYAMVLRFFSKSNEDKTLINDMEEIANYMKDKMENFLQILDIQIGLFIDSMNQQKIFHIQKRPIEKTIYFQKLNHLKLNGSVKGQQILNWDVTTTLVENLTKIQKILNFNNLEHLQLQCNQITQIENLQHFTKLQTLYLSGNKIEKIQNLKSLKNLKSLSLNGNFITKIQCLQNLTSLKDLGLALNKIKKIQNLQNLQGLLTLDLSSNEITEISNLQKLTKLKILGLDYNKIQKIQNLQKLESLVKLYLNNNQILKIQGLDMLNNLQQLYVGQNKIEQSFIEEERNKLNKRVKIYHLKCEKQKIEN